MFPPFHPPAPHHFLPLLSTFFLWFLSDTRSLSLSQTAGEAGMRSLIIYPPAPKLLHTHICSFFSIWSPPLSLVSVMKLEWWISVRLLLFTTSLFQPDQMTSAHMKLQNSRQLAVLVIFLIYHKKQHCPKLTDVNLKQLQLFPLQSWLFFRLLYRDSNPTRRRCINTILLHIQRDQVSITWSFMCSSSLFRDPSGSRNHIRQHTLVV